MLDGPPAEITMTDAPRTADVTSLTTFTDTNIDPRLLNPDPVTVELNENLDSQSDSLPNEEDKSEHGASDDSSEDGRSDAEMESPEAAEAEEQLEDLEESTNPDVLHKSLAVALKKEQRKAKKSERSDEYKARRHLEIEALIQFNDLRLKLALQVKAWKDALKKIPKSRRAIHKMKMKKIKPSVDASKSIANRCSKGPYFARRLRHMAAHLLRSGCLPENNSGKGARHATWLAEPQVSEAIEEWLKGTMPFEEGGYNGKVCTEPGSYSSARWKSKNPVRCDLQSYAVISMDFYFQSYILKIQFLRAPLFDGSRILDSSYHESRRGYTLMAMNVLMLWRPERNM